MQKNKNSLYVPFIAANYEAGVDELNRKFAVCSTGKLLFEPWQNENAKTAEVSFKIFHSSDTLFLKYIVKEKHPLTNYQHTNDLVYNDSCVEFFISLTPNGEYYNFEFNALGTPYAAFGKSRSRELLEPSVVNQIKRYSLIQTIPNDALPHHWELIVIIPFAVFDKDNIRSLTGVKATGNFYKCGDKLPEPHYLCWNNIETIEPDFHRPEYFGKLFFE